MKKTYLGLLASLCALAACTTPRTGAPVIEHPQASERPADVGRLPSSSTKPVEKKADARGFYTVKKGDTLLQIAFDFGQNYRDLVAWNNLMDPNDIKIDQVLRVIPPDGANSPVQTGSVAAPGAGVEVKPLPSAPSTPAPAVAVPHKSSPRGDKRAFSTAALGEMQRADGPATNGTGIKADSPKAVEPKSTDVPAAVNDDDAILWIWPVEGKIIAGFDESRKGIDIGGQIGHPVVAAGAGRVMYAGSGIRGYGNLVIVKHTNNLLSAYAHNKTILVKEGQTVSKGQKIAEMGNSDSDTVKLHFEIRQQGKPVDPSKFLPAR